MKSGLPSIDPELPRVSKPWQGETGEGNGLLGTTFTNWAQTFTCQPDLFFTPRNQEEVKEVLRLARQHKKHVTCVGAGHSPGDIACTNDYMISLDHLCSMIAIDKRSKCVTVEAGMRLYQIHELLDSHGLAMANLGSISEQSIGGAIATATHGSSTRHQILSAQVVELKLILADGSERTCSNNKEPDLFKAALVSLGALGVVVEVTIQAEHAYDVRSTQHIRSFSNMLEDWSNQVLWDSSEFVRVWWFPYSKKTVIWKGDREVAGKFPSKSDKSWYRGMFWAYHVQQALLFLGRYFPSSNPSIERTVFANHYGSSEGKIGESIEKSYVSLNMNCLFSQYVNEWAIPYEKGIEACQRLNMWLEGDIEGSRIPFSSEGIYVHAPIELRVTASSPEDAWLSTSWGGLTCYVGIIMYKPYQAPVPYRKFFQAYEYLMRDLGGRPHWAKQHDMTKKELMDRYPKLPDWLAVRNEVDPEGLFLTEYHKRHLINEDGHDAGVFDGCQGRLYKALRPFISKL